MERWLLIDTSYLVYRAHFAAKDGAAMFGFVAAIAALHDRFDTDNFVFCFDHGRLKRQDDLPSYKDRSDLPDSMKEHRIEAKATIEKLRRSVLAEWGFQNIMWQKGYEADDVIASVIHNNIIGSHKTGIIISSDADLLQLLCANVSMYNPAKKQLTTADTFVDQWEISPTQWAFVKAIAGCSSDNIKGVRGVGEKTAAQYVAGSLGEHTKKYQLISNADYAEFRDRLKLVKLPYPGVREFKLNDQPRVDWRSIQLHGA